MYDANFYVSSLEKSINYNYSAVKLFFIKESLNYFGERRTDRREGSMFQGVETPSQVIQRAIFVNLIKKNYI